MKKQLLLGLSIFLMNSIFLIQSGISEKDFLSKMKFAIKSGNYNSGNEDEYKMKKLLDNNPNHWSYFINKFKLFMPRQFKWFQMIPFQKLIDYLKFHLTSDVYKALEKKARTYFFEPAYHQFNKQYYESIQGFGHNNVWDSNSIGLEYLGWTRLGNSNYGKTWYGDPTSKIYYGVTEDVNPENICQSTQRCSSNRWYCNVIWNKIYTDHEEKEPFVICGDQSGWQQR